MKTTINRQFAVGDYKYLIEITEFESRYVLTVSLEGEVLLTLQYFSSEDAMVMGKRWCYLDGGKRMDMISDSCADC